MKMYFLRDEILKAVGKGRIEAVVIGRLGYEDEDIVELIPDYDKMPKGKVLSWEVASELLNYGYDASYECTPIYVWTKTRIIFIGQYDGTTKIYSIPRHPIDELPVMPGE